MRNNRAGKSNPRRGKRFSEEGAVPKKSSDKKEFKRTVDKKDTKRTFDKKEVKSIADKKDTKRTFDKKEVKRTFDKKDTKRTAWRSDKRKFSSSSAKNNQPKQESEGTRLNKYLSNSGICSRREADKLIASGVVKINGVVVTEMGVKIKAEDVVVFGGQKISHEKKVYILLNKPKDYITTSKDPQERRTVMHLVEGACRERVYPVGRLDRMTTGVLLLTNDGDLTKKLTHPSSDMKKIYYVQLDQVFSKEDMKKLMTEGVELEDGLVKVDQIAYVEGGKSRKEIGIEIHSGKNRVIRRIMEALGYQVVKLDRVYFAGLTKKGLARGKYRFLNEKEVLSLKRL